MPTYSRRDAIRATTALGSLALAALSPPAGAQPRSTTRRGRAPINFVADGLQLSPADYAARLDELARDQRIAIDDYSRGGVVEALELACAQLLGKEAAIFMPTGTLANHLALRAHCVRGERVLVQHESHVYNDSGDCVQTLSQLTLVPLAPATAGFTVEDVENALNRAVGGRVRTRVGAISIESPVRRRSGETFPMDDLRRIVELARREGIALHLDGARLLIASAYSGIAPADYAAAFDTVYVSLYKGLNAASGAILAGPRELLKDMHHVRRMFGGGLPAAWPFAAVPLAELAGFHDRLRRGIEVSESFFRALEADGRVRVVRIPNGTNVARLLLGQLDASEFRARLEPAGIHVRQPNGEPAELTVTVNESWGARSGEEIAGEFLRALG